MTFFLRRYATIPNILTTCRLVMAPCLCIMLANGYVGWGLVLMLSSAVTDFLDGFLARLLNQQSAFGKVYDPFVDRIFTIFLLCGLFCMDLFPLWFLMILLSRELIIGLGILILSRFYATIDIVILWSGKCTIFVTFTLVCFVLLLNILGVIMPLWLYLLVYVSWTFMLIYSLVDYTLYYVGMIKNGYGTKQ